MICTLYVYAYTQKRNTNKHTHTHNSLPHRKPYSSSPTYTKHIYTKKKKKKKKKVGIPYPLLTIANEADSAYAMRQ